MTFTLEVSEILRLVREFDWTDCGFDWSFFVEVYHDPVLRTISALIWDLIGFPFFLVLSVWVFDACSCRSRSGTLSAC